MFLAETLGIGIKSMMKTGQLAKPYLNVITVGQLINQSIKQIRSKYVIHRQLYSMDYFSILMLN